uniref:Mitochondrial carrier n=1 Tax=Mycena chlorophos TaxID=658473 RepID=A0ABQ0LX52_MYCCL|nr:predicted protein [Mycena chlorophos]
MTSTISILPDSIQVKHAIQVVAAILVSTVVYFVVSTPLVGALVRLRADYKPRRRVQLPTDATADADVMMPADQERGGSYFGMLERIRRIEGWAGLYKGIMPSIIQGVLSIVLVVPSLVTLALLLDRVLFPQTHVGRVYASFCAVFFVLLFVPLEVMKTRIITTPYRLRAFEPMVALRAILSPSERAQPWRLYLLPGVAAATFLEAFIALAVNALWLFVTGAQRPNHGPPESLARAVYYTIAVALLALSTGVLTSLDVLRIRLSLQRLPGETTVASGELAVYSATEEVLEVRVEQLPYTSFRDAVRSIVAEEGKHALLRGWWITALGLLPMFLVPWAPMYLPPW